MGGSLTGLAYLAAVVVVATAVQTAIGFGSMLIAVTFGIFWFTVPELTALLIPLSLVQTTVVVARHPGDVDVRTLFSRVVPWMGAGILSSLALVGAEPAPWMRPAFGGLVLALAIRELVLAARETPVGPPPHAAANAALVVAGLVHGVFATGGPPLVWALAQEEQDKARFRTTLTAVWVVVNTGLVTAFAWRGTLTMETLQRSAILLVPMFVGLFIGEQLHARVDEGRFRLGVWLLLALAALPLIAM